MSSGVQTAQTLDDLMRVDGKAELIGGRIVHLMPTGHSPNLVAGRIFRSPAGFVETLARGEVYTDNMGFTVPELSSGRMTFSPDVAYFDGQLPSNPMRFVEGPPSFAVEVRSENDYGPAAEEEMAAKRADYFEAGTLIVWDVDPVDDVIHVYRSENPTTVEFYPKSREIGAGPTLPGWQVSVDWIFA